TALAAALTQHAGQFDYSLAQGDADTDLGSNPSSESLLLNVRHRFGAGIEAYFDALVLSSHGESTDRTSEGEGVLAGSSPANPFVNDIQVFFPVSQMAQQSSQRATTQRYTAGLLAELPVDWRVMADASAGSYRYSSSLSQKNPSQAVFVLFGDP